MCGNCGMINFGLWNSLYPYNYSTNVAGRWQFNVMPLDYTPQQAFAIQNLFNPFYHFANFMNSANAISNPFQNPQQAYFNNAAYAQGYQAGDSIGLNVALQNSNGNIASLKAHLESALSSDKLNAQQKNRLETLKKEVEILEQRMQDLVALRQRGAQNNQVRAGLSQINEFYRDLRDRVRQAAEEIQAQISAGSSTGSTENGNSTGSTGSTGAGAEVSERVQNLNVTTFNENIVTADVNDAQVSEIVNNIYQKVDGVGSSDAKKYLDENINKDNVVEVMLHWNKHYAEQYAEADPHGFTETLMDERLVSGRKLCTKVLESLEERLEEYKDIDTACYNEAKTQLSIARREHDATFWTSEDKMSEAINKAHKAIVLLMAQKANQAE
ncbi:hypothetical protein IJZ97_00510 [bacterium]|nr:hypothetical protein [bacterium]